MSRRARPIGLIWLLALLAGSCENVPTQANVLSELDAAVPWGQISGRIVFSTYACLRDVDQCSSHLYILDPARRESRQLARDYRSTFWNLAWSPRDDLISFTPGLISSDEYLWTVRTDGTDRRQRFPMPFPSSPTWSSDGRGAWSGWAPGRALIIDREPLLELPLDLFSRPAWSPDDSTLLVILNGDSPGLHKVTVADKSIVPVLIGIPLRNPVYSPDGRSIAFSIYNSGLWVMAADGTGLRQVTTSQWDEEPAWSPDGSAIAFLRDGALLMVGAGGGTVTKVVSLRHVTVRSLTWAR